MGLTGGTVRTPYGLKSWQPVRPVATMFAYYTANTGDGYVCAGVIGNTAHLGRRPPEDHTPYSRDSIWSGGRHYIPKAGWVYAIDGHVPEQQKFERWFLARIRAGFYPWVKYFNINNRRWTRANRFASAFTSADEHLHVSVMPGSEYAGGNPLADYQYWRVHGRNVPTRKPQPPIPHRGILDAAARKLPEQRRGSRGVPVRIAQAALIAGGSFLPHERSQIDGIFGDHTDAAVRELQRATAITVDGIIGIHTWDALFPEDNPTVSRGSHGRYALLMQSLLFARGFDPGPLDADFGDLSVAALKRFQVAHRVARSVVRGRGDGIGGDATWEALITVATAGGNA